MTSFFISYSREIEKQVKVLANDLVESDYEVWVDHHLTGGEEWWGRILNEICACDVFIYALSPETLKSEACKKEFSYACSVKRPILPVKLVKMSDNLIPDTVGKLQHVDYVNADLAAFKSLVKTINKLPEAPGLPDPLPAAPKTPTSYLGELRGRIEQPELGKDEQNSIYAELSVKVHDGEDLDDIRDLVSIFLARNDNYAITEKNLIALQRLLSGKSAFEPVKPKGEGLEPTPETEPEIKTQPVDMMDALNIDPGSAEASIKQILQSVVGKGETWIIESDKLNKITLTAGAENKERQVCAQVKCRDKATGSRQESFKKLGWKTKDNSTVAGLAGGALAYATGGAALLALCSKNVRDYMLVFEATREWVVSKKGSELSKIAMELSRILEQISSNKLPLLAWRNVEA